jgi:primosomal protein N' (replication factor Y)
MTDELPLLRVAVPVPVFGTFDYQWSGAGQSPPVGARVRVPFGKSHKVGIVVEHPALSGVSSAALKRVAEHLDTEPVLDRELLATLRWCADYYHHPLGEVLHHALPALLRRGKSELSAREQYFALSLSGATADLSHIATRAPRQSDALRLLRERSPLSSTELRAAGVAAATLRRLSEKGWVSMEAGDRAPPTQAASTDGQAPELTAAQAAAVAAIDAARERFAAFLLFGVTGSGKTEVFLRLIDRALKSGRQTLLLVPEISLTPQLVQRLSARFGGALAVAHSGLTDTERLRAWQSARAGPARLIVGTRSAVFSPLPNPGLIIVDEEHDPSFKQQTGLRYSARDLAVMRARTLGVPVVLASATPSLETFHNARSGRYAELVLPDRIGAAGAPTMHVIDMNQHAARQGLSTPLLSHIDQHLERGNQVLLFINRRGFAPVLFCTGCAAVEDCTRCDAHLTVHARAAVLRCHHCGRETALHWKCPSCSAERVAVGEGTQRITEELAALYPQHKIARLDRDALSRRDALGQILGDVESGDTRIIVGTQLLAKGHDFPGVTLVGILNADQGLFGTDFRAEERLAQTIVQVAGRAGRRDLLGDVVIQTHFPQHPLLASLLKSDYSAFAEASLVERQQSRWPPFSRIAVWRAEASAKGPVFDFLNRLKRHMVASPVTVLGPTTHAMERVGGRFRGQLLLQSENRSELHAAAESCLTALRGWTEARRVRWSLDVDPVEL